MESLNVVRRNDRAAVANMAAAVAMYSVIPLALVGTGGIVSPLLFNGGWRLGLAVGYAVYLLLRHRDLVLNGAVLRLLLRRLWRWPTLALLFNNFELALLSASARYVDIAVSAVVYETYHIGVMALTAWLFRDVRRYQPVTGVTLALMMLGLVGVALVVSAESDTLEAWTGASGYRLMSGLSLAVSAALAAACAAFAFRWGADCSRELERLGVAPGDGRADVFGVVSVNCAANAVCGPLSLALGFGFGEAGRLGVVLVGLMGGMLLNAAPSVLWRRANVMARSLAVNALGYATPVLALCWLWLFGLAQVTAWPYLVAGTALVVGANGLLRLERERAESAGRVGDAK